MKNLIRKLRARLARTWVTDCPVCFQYFYGFHNYSHQVVVGTQNYRIICHRCTEKHCSKASQQLLSS